MRLGSVIIVVAVAVVAAAGGWARAGVGVELDGSEAFVVVGFCE